MSTTESAELGKHLLSIKLQIPSSDDGANTTITTSSPTSTTTQSINDRIKLIAKKFNTETPTLHYKQKASLCMYLAAFSALLGAISFGLGIGWTAPAFEQLANETSIPYLYEPRDTEILSWISSSLPLSALFGALLSDHIVQRYGRRKSLLLYDFPFLFGWLLIIVSKSAYIFLIGRIILGLAIGSLSCTAPPYIIDISTVKIRGTLGALFQLFIVTGILFAYVIGAMLPWRMASIVSITPAVAQIILMYFMPEGPNWLLQNNRIEEAKKALIRIRSKDSDIDKEFEILSKLSNQRTKAQNNESKNEQKTKWELYLKKRHLFPLLLSLALMIFQQLSGVNAVMFYATSILQESGSSIAPSLGTIMVGVAQWIASLFGAIFVDVAGRRPLLIASGIIHVFSMMIFGIYYYFPSPNSFGWIPVVSMIIFIIGFSIGWGPVPWLMVAEITPNESKSKTVAMSTCANWTLAFLVTKTFKELQEMISKDCVFYLFAGFSAISVLFAKFVLPETSHKSYEEIQEYFQSKTKIKDNKLSSVDSPSKASDTLTRSSDST